MSNDSRIIRINSEAIITANKTKDDSFRTSFSLNIDGVNKQYPVIRKGVDVRRIPLYQDKADPAPSDITAMNDTVFNFSNNTFNVTTGTDPLTQGWLVRRPEIIMNKLWTSHAWFEYPSGKIAKLEYRSKAATAKKFSDPEGHASLEKYLESPTAEEYKTVKRVDPSDAFVMDAPEDYYYSSVIVISDDVKHPLYVVFDVRDPLTTDVSEDENRIMKANPLLIVTDPDVRQVKIENISLEDVKASVLTSTKKIT